MKNRQLIGFVVAGLLLCAAGWLAGSAVYAQSGGVEVNSGGGTAPSAAISVVVDLTKAPVGTGEFGAYTNTYSGSGITYQIPELTSQTTYSGINYGPSTVPPSDVGAYQVQVVSSFAGGTLSYTNTSLLVIE
jgi:hypothetical protein